MSDGVSYIRTTAQREGQVNGKPQCSVSYLGGYRPPAWSILILPKVRTYARTYETKNILYMSGCGGSTIKIQGVQIIFLTLSRMDNGMESTMSLTLVATGCPPEASLSYICENLCEYL